MIRFLLRLLGFLILAGGFVALVIDGTRSIAAGAIGFTSTEASWTAFSPETLQKTQGFVAESVPAAAGALAWALAQPTCLVLCVIGILLMLIGRRKRRSVGVEP